MNKFNQFLIALILTVPTLIFSQEHSDYEPAKINLELSLIYAPIGTSFFENNNPFEVKNSIYLGVSLVYKNFLASPFYSLSTNSVGSFFSYALNENMSSYVVVDKSINDNNVGIGLGASFASWNANILPFVEFGRFYDEDSRWYTSIGVYFLFNKKL